MSPAPLLPEKLYKRCDPDALPFATTAELEELTLPVGQDRAIAALEFGIGIRSQGYNIYALGPEGSGKDSLIRLLLAKAAESQAAPDDWCYVHNFADAHRPRALRLPKGRAVGLRKDMETLVEELRAAIPAAFDGDEYRSHKQVIEERYKERQEQSFADIGKRAAEQSIALIRTPVGFALAPMKEGEVLSPDEFKQLPEAAQDDFKHKMEEFQQEMEERLRHMPRWEKELREEIRKLNREVTMFAVGHLIEEIEKSYADIPAVLEYLEAVRKDVVENVGDFLPSSESDDGHIPPAMRQGAGRGVATRRYQVNVLVSHCEACGAPVVHEDNPTQPNLVGRIEHIAQFGALITDFNLIKAGALHRANGGYLVIEARRLLSQPFAYDDLKRALRSREIRIEPPGYGWGMLSTTTLEPEPIPLNVKVVLAGDPMLYYLLSHYDPEFPELFKVGADFDYRMDRNETGILGYARMIATLIRKEDLRPLSKGAVARVVEHGARLAEDAEKLSTHMASIADLVREADHWAGSEKAEIVEAPHVAKAIFAHEYRLDRVREHVQEEIQRGTYLIDSSGEAVGQVNALSVMQLGRFSFGRPSRITCRVRMGKGEVIDIEREVQLGGPLHTKGVMILSAFLAARYAALTHLSLTASLVFEQSYGGVDGDSASSAELYALLSALAEAPLKQSLAVTGSVNQFGQVQPIGGVNEKIEGFFDVCKARGLDGTQGVLIPETNVKHLMLREDVVAACAEGKFAIYPIKTIDEGIALLTGLPAGELDAKKEYPVGSVNRRVAAKLATFSAKSQPPPMMMQRNGR
jgi:predicted ATP-dependent protease